MLLWPAVCVLLTGKSVSRGVGWHSIALLVFWACGKQDAASSLGVIYWFGPGAVFFAEDKVESVLSYVEEAHTLIWEPKLLQRSEYFELPPSCNLWLGHAAWELLIPAVLPEYKKCYMQLKEDKSDSLWDSSFLFSHGANTVLSFGLNSTNDASTRSTRLSMSMNRELLIKPLIVFNSKIIPV